MDEPSMELSSSPSGLDEQTSQMLDSPVIAAQASPPTRYVDEPYCFFSHHGSAKSYHTHAMPQMRTILEVHEPSGGVSHTLVDESSTENMTAIDGVKSESWSGTTFTEANHEPTGDSVYTITPSPYLCPHDSVLASDSELHTLVADMSAHSIPIRSNYKPHISSSFGTTLRETSIKEIQEMNRTSLALPSMEIDVGLRAHSASRSLQMETKLTPRGTSSGRHNAVDLIPFRLSEYQLRLAMDLNAIGTKWHDELRFRKEASRPTIVAASQINGANRQNPEVLLERILHLVKSSNSKADPEKLNDFLNGLDLVAEDLLQRFPQDLTACGLQSALASVLRGTTRQPSCCTGTTTQQPQSANTTPVGARVCPDSHNTTTAHYSCSSLSQTSGPNLSGTHKQGLCKVDSPPTSSIDGLDPGITNGVHTSRRKLDTRLLACPVKKDDEVTHGRHSSCRYKGAPNMSSLKTHLTSRNHHSDVSFICFCRPCSDYIIDKREWLDNHVTRRCIQQTGLSNKQIRGSGVEKQWSRLYDKMFPQSPGFPSPYVNDPTWRARTRASSSQYVASESTTQASGRETKSDNPPAVDSILQEIVSFPSDDDPNHRTRNSIIEPLPTTIQSPYLTLDGCLLDNTQSFLDGPSNGAHNELQASSGTLPSTIGEAEIVGAELSVVNSQANGFPFYYDNAPNDPSASLTNQLHASERQSQLHSNIDEINPSHMAALLFILEHSGSYAQSSNSGSEVNTAEQVAHASALGREQFENLANMAKASIDAIAEWLGSRNASVSLGNNNATIHTFQRATDLILEAVSTELQDTAWMDVAPPNIHRQTGLSLDAADEDPFVQLAWDDSEIMDWEPPSSAPQLQEVV